MKEALKQQNLVPDEQVQKDKIYTVYLLSVLKRDLGQPDEAERLGRQALSLAIEKFGATSSITQSCRYTLSDILHVNMKFEEASELMDEWFSLLVSTKQINLADSQVNQLVNQAQFLRISGKNIEAEQILRKVLKHQIAEFGAHHHQVALILKDLGTSLMESGKVSEAELILRKAVKIFRSTEPESQNELGSTLGSLAFLVSLRGAYSESDKLFMEAITLQKNNYGRDNFRLKNVQRAFAGSLFDQQKYEKAISILEEVHAFYKKKFGPEYMFTLLIETDLAITYKDMGQDQKAEILLQNVLQKCDKVYGEMHYRSAYARVTYSNLLLTQGKLKKAEEFARQAYELLQKNTPHKIHDLTMAKQQLALCLKKQKYFEEAENLLIDTFNFLSKQRGLKSSATRKGLKDLIALYEEWGKPEMAEPYKEQLALVHNAQM